MKLPMLADPAPDITITEVDITKGDTKVTIDLEKSYFLWPVI